MTSAEFIFDSLSGLCQDFKKEIMPQLAVMFSLTLVKYLINLKLKITIIIALNL